MKAILILLCIIAALLLAAAVMFKAIVRLRRERSALRSRLAQRERALDAFGSYFKNTEAVNAWEKERGRQADGDPLAVIGAVVGANNDRLPDDGGNGGSASAEAGAPAAGCSG